MTSQDPPFVGCRIRIISKAKIRYEGKLHSIDTDTPNDPVITLSKVCSFGTENRVCDRPIGPRSEVYEQIVFRGRDLEDVRVIQSPVFLNDDPSIVSALPEVGHLASNRPKEDGDSVDPWSSTLSINNANQTDPLNPPKESSASNFPNFMSSKQANFVREMLPDSWNPLSQLSSEYEPQPNEYKFNESNNARNVEHFCDNYGDVISVSKESDNYNKYRGYNQNTNQNRYPSQMHYNEYNRYQRREHGNNRFHRGNNQSINNYDRGRRRNYKPWSDTPNIKVPASTFEGDYDIDKANAELAEELEKIDISESSINGSINGATENLETKDLIYYDSKKSFFDSISSELMDRTQGNSSKRPQHDNRKLNFDTFGITFNHVNRGSYRGRGRHLYNNQSGGHSSSGPRRPNWQSNQPKYRQHTNNQSDAY